MPYRTTEKMAARKEAHRNRFLEAATRLFGDNGYHATTVPAIVAAAGSSTGSFYFYFSNKEEIFAAVLELVGKRMAEALNEAIDAVPDVLGQMRAAVESLVLWLAENPRQARILIVESSGLGEDLKRVREAILERHAAGVERALRSIAEEGAAGDGKPQVEGGARGAIDAVRVADPEIAARCWVGATHEAVRHWLEIPSARRPPARRVAAEIADFNLRGIGVPPGPRGSAGPSPAQSRGAGRRSAQDDADDASSARGPGRKNDG